MKKTIESCHVSKWHNMSSQIKLIEIHSVYMWCVLTNQIRVHHFQFDWPKKVYKLIWTPPKKEDPFGNKKKVMAWSKCISFYLFCQLSIQLQAMLYRNCCKATGREKNTKQCSVFVVTCPWKALLQKQTIALSPKI